MTETILSVEDLHVAFPTEDGLVQAVNGVSFDLGRGKTVAIVGESGSGKSVTAQSIMGLINPRTAHMTGKVMFEGQDLVTTPEKEMYHLRGARMSMIFQDPMSSLHPFYRIGAQLSEAVRVHQKVSKKEAREQSIEMLQKVGIPAAERRIDDYPHQLSGGMRQRVMIAMALINSPSLLIADEPTTALDVTVQAQILELIAEIQDGYDTAIIMITHDLGVVAGIADDVVVMYGGNVVESAPVHELFASPQMPYTLGLLSSIPRLDRDPSQRLDPIPGNPPSLISAPAGCVFSPRCEYTARVADDACHTTRPALLEAGPDHRVRCHIPREEREQLGHEVLASLVLTPPDGGPV
ncbi:MAG: ABC transporter ATP-binding protein [Candidatus Nanopelagicales bacterium]